MSEINNPHVSSENDKKHVVDSEKVSVSHCTNTPTWKVTFLDTKRTTPACDDCVKLLKIMGKGHEDKYRVEAID